MPQPVSMQQKEECIRNFRAVTSSESLRQLTCASCTEDVNCSERKVVSIDDIGVSLMRDCTDRIFDTGQYIPPDLPFADGPLANMLADHQSQALPLAGLVPYSYLCPGRRTRGVAFWMSPLCSRA